MRKEETTCLKTFRHPCPQPLSSPPASPLLTPNLTAGPEGCPPRHPENLASFDQGSAWLGTWSVSHSGLVASLVSVLWSRWHDTLPLRDLSRKGQQTRCLGTPGLCPQQQRCPCHRPPMGRPMSHDALELAVMSARCCFALTSRPDFVDLWSPPSSHAAGQEKLPRFSTRGIEGMYLNFAAGYLTRTWRYPPTWTCTRPPCQAADSTSHGAGSSSTLPSLSERQWDYCLGEIREIHPAKAAACEHEGRDRPCRDVPFCEPAHDMYSTWGGQMVCPSPTRYGEPIRSAEN